MTSAQLDRDRGQGGCFIRPATDLDRILGQIERDEIRVGPDAAREIAARAEAAYGDAWRTGTGTA